MPHRLLVVSVCLLLQLVTRASVSQLAALLYRWPQWSILPFGEAPAHFFFMLRLRKSCALARLLHSDGSSRKLVARRYMYLQSQIPVLVLSIAEAFEVRAVERAHPLGE